MSRARRQRRELVSVVVRVDVGAALGAQHKTRRRLRQSARVRPRHDAARHRTARPANAGLIGVKKVPSLVPVVFPRPGAVQTALSRRSHQRTSTLQYTSRLAGLISLSLSRRSVEESRRRLGLESVSQHRIERVPRDACRDRNTVETASLSKRANFFFRSLSLSLSITDSVRTRACFDTCTGLEATELGRRRTVERRKETEKQNITQERPTMQFQTESLMCS